MKMTLVLTLALQVTSAAFGAELVSKLTPFGATNLDADAIELKNDGYNEAGGPAYVQAGFVKGEKAGVWVKVPANVPYFQPQFFRVLIANGRLSETDVTTQAFFEMGVAADGKYSPSIPREIENAVQLTPGPYWNDIPAIGARGAIRCAKAGELVGAALEFVHEGLPSVFRDADGLTNPLANVLFAIPGGWNFSNTFGLQGDWVLRVVGRSVAASECK